MLPLHPHRGGAPPVAPCLVECAKRTGADERWRGQDKKTGQEDRARSGKRSELRAAEGSCFSNPRAFCG